MRSVYTAKLTQQTQILIQIYQEEEQTEAQQTKLRRETAEQTLEKLQEQQDRLLLHALRACLASGKSYEDIMTFLNEEQYDGKAGDYETVNVRNGMQYIQRKFRETFKNLKEKPIHSDEEREEVQRVTRRLMREECNVRNRMLMAIKMSRRTYEEILAYAREPRQRR